jgi:hypothetical protein
MDKLGQITTLLKTNGINTVASQLKMKKADIYKFLKSNGLIYEDGEVKPIMDSNIKNEMAVTNVIQKDNTENKPSNNKPPQSVIQSLNKDIDISKLSEKIDMIEPLKAIIKQHDKNIIEIEKAELKPPSVTEVKQKLFKIDVNVLEQWNLFVENHKSFKVQSLISLALQEFIDKYK